MTTIAYRDMLALSPSRKPLSRPSCNSEWKSISTKSIACSTVLTYDSFSILSTPLSSIVLTFDFWLRSDRFQDKENIITQSTSSNEQLKSELERQQKDFQKKLMAMKVRELSVSYTSSHTITTRSCIVLFHINSRASPRRFKAVKSPTRSLISMETQWRS